MRHISRFILAGVCVVGLVAPVAAGDREDALAVVDQAIKAHGGEDALAKAQIMIRTGTGVLYQGGKELPFTDEVTMNLPDQLRIVVEVNKTLKISFAVNGDKGWESVGGPVADLGADRLKELREELYVSWLTTLTPLKKEGFELTPLPDLKVNGDPAVGIKIVRKGHADARLYFDKSSKLLVKIERKTQEAGLTLDKEYFYGEHKEFDGVKMPTRLIEMLDGKKFSEVTSASYKFPRKLDDGTFAKP